jgi:hypothetical protein
MNLWVNPDYFLNPGDRKYALYALLESHGVKLRNYKGLEIASSDFRDLFEAIDYTHMIKPVIASDILRLLSLFHEGGIYFDADTMFKSSLPLEPIEFKEDQTIIIDETRLDPLSVQETSVMNSFLASTRGAKEISILLTQIQGNISKNPLEKLLEWNVDDVIDNTGPGLLFKLGGGDVTGDMNTVTRAEALDIHSKTFSYSRKHYPELLSFKSHACDGSWYEAAKLNLKRRDQGKVLAAAALLCWKKGGYTDESILKKGFTVPDLDSDDLSRPGCCVM